ncbi:MAG: hypothetical protein ACJ77K_06790 [Bacteroidia bacterium]
MNRIIEKYSKSQKAGVLEIFLSPDGARNYRFCIAEFIKGGLRFSSEKEGSSLREAAQMGSTLPVLLFLSGKGVLKKIIAGSESEDESSLLNRAVPDAAGSGLCAQFEKENEDQMCIKLVRTALLDELILELRKEKVTKIIACRLCGTEDSQESVRLFFSDELKIVKGHANLDLLAAEYLNNRKLRTKVIALLACTFTILLLNYFVYDHYHSILGELNAKMNVGQTSLEQYEKVKAEWSEKKTFLDQNGFSVAAQTSFYADRLAAALPEEVSWTRLVIHPVKKRTDGDEEKSLQFENRNIIVDGNCKKSIALNDWIKTVRKMSWVADVSMLNYAQEDAHDAGNFSISIALK